MCGISGPLEPTSAAPKTRRPPNLKDRVGLSFPSSGGDRLTKDREARLLAIRSGSFGLASLTGSETHLCPVAALPVAIALEAVSSAEERYYFSSSGACIKKKRTFNAE